MGQGLCLVLGDMVQTERRPPSLCHVSVVKSGPLGPLDPAPAGPRKSCRGRVSHTGTAGRLFPWKQAWRKLISTTARSPREADASAGCLLVAAPAAPKLLAHLSAGTVREECGSDVTQSGSKPASPTCRPENPIAGRQGGGQMSPQRVWGRMRVQDLRVPPTWEPRAACGGSRTKRT